MTQGRLFALVTVAAFAALVAASSEASAFCRATTCQGDVKKGECHPDEGMCPTDGSYVNWTHMPLTYRFAGRPANLNREEARAAIREAFNRWSDALCGPDNRRTSLRFVEGEDLSEIKPLVPKAQASEPFGIFFRDTGWPYEGGSADSTLAQTNLSFGVQTGRVGYADIEINTGYIGAQKIVTGDADQPGTADLQAVITHEVGHFIGLAHSSVPESIMLWQYCAPDDHRCDRSKVAARRLGNDDLEAVCTLYPPDQVLPATDDNASPAARACSAPASPTPALPSYATFAVAVGALSVVRSIRLRRR